MAGKPKAEAIQISKILNITLGQDRFPVDVKSVAIELTKSKFPDQRISDIKALDLPGFEGMLVEHPSRKKWMIAYNSSLPSEGRIRFTLAHEFGHYILHRHLQNEFNCTKNDVSENEVSQSKSMELEADDFASSLLMPLDDFRQQTSNQDPSIELIQHCASRYGVSMMAAALKWKEIAKDRVIVIAVRDGFLQWAVANEAAYKSGAYLRTKKETIPVPKGSLLESSIWKPFGESKEQKANLWFSNEPLDMPLIEHTYVAQEDFDYTLGLLIMPAAEHLHRKETLYDSPMLTPLNGYLTQKR